MTRPSHGSVPRNRRRLAAAAGAGVSLAPRRGGLLCPHGCVAAGGGGTADAAWTFGVGLAA